MKNINNFYTSLLALKLQQLKYEFSKDLQSGILSKSEFDRILNLKKLELILRYAKSLPKEGNHDYI